MIATESGDPARGLGIANSALEYKDALTPRLRVVILRQRSYSNAALGEVIASARDSDEAVIKAVAGENQGDVDPAPYCTPTYAAMEAGASWVILGHPKTALPILEKSRIEWLDHMQVRVRSDVPSRPSRSQSFTASRTVWVLEDLTAVLSSSCSALSLSRTSCLVLPRTFRRIRLPSGP